jgi:hypothetical protein
MISYCNLTALKISNRESQRKEPETSAIFNYCAPRQACESMMIEGFEKYAGEKPKSDGRMGN